MPLFDVVARWDVTTSYERSYLIDAPSWEDAATEVTEALDAIDILDTHFWKEVDSTSSHAIDSLVKVED